MNRRNLLLTIVLTGAAQASQAQQAPDPFLWLEEVEGRRALEWVRARNTATAAELEKVPEYQSIYANTLRILDSRDRIASPSIRGDRIYNFWQDAEHPRGILRRSTWADYVGGRPRWETVLDIDALAKAENVAWSYGGSTCLGPENRRCLVMLSRGGADATEIREFEAVTKQFVADGFRLSEAKQSVAWVDENTLLVATDFGPGTMTTSGYPRVVKLWKRGTPLSAATTLFEAAPTDMGTFVGRIETGSRAYAVVSHARNFYEGTTSVLQDGRLVKLDVPLDADTQILGDQLIVYVRSPWEVAGRRYEIGSLLGIALADYLAGKRELKLILAPGPRETINGVSTTRDYLLVGMLNNVRGELRKYRYQNGTWTFDKVPAPEMGSIGVAATTPTSNRYFFLFSGFAQPSTLYVAEEDGSVKEVQRLPAMFDAKDVRVEQREAVSKDGTRIPFFLVHRGELARDGRSPTLLYAYGGFEVAQTPGYNPTLGAAWLEHGGVYVLANIRGGGEFGPAWHRAGLKENRQRVFDDFIAVAEEVVRQKITSPQHLGIMGGSNGGLLTGVAFTQRPDLFNAAVVQVPLLDMQRYNKLLAGASWMAEYGDPDKPDEWAFISKYSPYHNLKSDAKYPRVLFTTTTRDDRVHPGHARKMAAKMESLGHAFYYFENTEGGHGAGVTSEQRAKMTAITYAYLWKQLGRRPTL